MKNSPLIISLFFYFSLFVNIYSAQKGMPKPNGAPTNPALALHVSVPAVAATSNKAALSKVSNDAGENATEQKTLNNDVQFKAKIKKAHSESRFEFINNGRSNRYLEVANKLSPKIQKALKEFASKDFNEKLVDTTTLPTMEEIDDAIRTVEDSKSFWKPSTKVLEEHLQKIKTIITVKEAAEKAAAEKAAKEKAANEAKEREFNAKLEAIKAASEKSKEAYKQKNKAAEDAKNDAAEKAAKEKAANEAKAMENLRNMRPSEILAAYEQDPSFFSKFNAEERAVLSNKLNPKQEINKAFWNRPEIATARKALAKENAIQNRMHENKKAHILKNINERKRDIEIQHTELFETKIADIVPGRHESDFREVSKEFERRHGRRGDFNDKSDKKEFNTIEKELIKRKRLTDLEEEEKNLNLRQEKVDEIARKEYEDERGLKAGDEARRIATRELRAARPEEGF